MFGWSAPLGTGKTSAGYDERLAVVSDADLVSRAVLGDEVAFGELLQSCRTRSWAVCYRICGNRDDAQDALQDAAIAAWRHLGSFTARSRFSTWFYRIAANASLQIVRRRRDSLPEDLLERLAVGDFSERLTQVSAVQEALAQVRPEFRAALVLREWGALTYEEIAEWQGVPVQTVKSRLNRARHSLAQLLAE